MIYRQLYCTMFFCWYFWFKQDQCNVAKQSIILTNIKIFASAFVLLEREWFCFVPLFIISSDMYDINIAYISALLELKLCFFTSIMKHQKFLSLLLEFQHNQLLPSWTPVLQAYRVEPGRHLSSKEHQRHLRTGTISWLQQLLRRLAKTWRGHWRDRRYLVMVTPRCDIGWSFWSSKTWRKLG